VRDAPRVTPDVAVTPPAPDVTVTPPAPAVAARIAPSEIEYLFDAIEGMARLRTGSSYLDSRIEPKEAKRVRTALFRKQLTDLGDCPTPFFEPKTWMEVDDLQSRNFEAGRFVSVVEQRIEGSFTGPDQDELLFVVRIGACGSNLLSHLVLAVFPRALGKPILRWDEIENPAARGRYLQAPRFLATVEDAHQPVRFLETFENKYRLVELNRPFVPGASFRNSTTTSPTPNGHAVIEPWSVVAEWSPPRSPPECHGFTGVRLQR
jgi:hypothetical protein